MGSKLIRGTEITVKPGYMSEQRFIANGSNSGSDEMKKRGS
ncbi:hypothetical protein PAUR_b0580 [Pseudoalteromonas aurantia 208]|uniref:Uncharacterized protein n=1 Tax=Pseudoalteromonas aurantia 208 TaxID=1314867 RepID=A0ABR9EI72_9GAMM|nr:hypothetical protein [Pseudoalteromonas aurantia 208]